MKKASKTSIPLVSFSSSRERWEPDTERGENIFVYENYTRISPSMELPGLCYGVRIEGVCHHPLLPQNCLAVFSQTEVTAIENIFAVRVQGDFPFVGKWIQKETPEGSLGGRRKVFMVPTPMHVPGSQTSPIASSTHQTLLFKDFASPDKLKVLPVSKVLWKHPLVYVQK
tara:strand:- start:536 stop:1045 length:510 start_codon:yes stop_codon:yes gene_type:complete